MVDIVVDDQHEPAPVWGFGIQDASVTWSATPRRAVHHPLFRDPLTAHDAEVGVPGTPPPRAE
jgi:hypothetical protein